MDAANVESRPPVCGRTTLPAGGCGGGSRSLGGVTEGWSDGRARRFHLRLWLRQIKRQFDFLTPHFGRHQSLHWFALRATSLCVRSFSESVSVSVRDGVGCLRVQPPNSSISFRDASFESFLFHQLLMIWHPLQTYIIAHQKMYSTTGSVMGRAVRATAQGPPLNRDLQLLIHNSK